MRINVPFVYDNVFYIRDFLQYRDNLPFILEMVHLIGLSLETPAGEKFGVSVEIALTFSIPSTLLT